MTLAVRPARTQRQDFARWASPLGVPTVSADAFGVPDHLFTDVPEPLLIGATINDQPYVPKES